MPSPPLATAGNAAAGDANAVEQLAITGDELGNPVTEETVVTEVAAAPERPKAAASRRTVTIPEPTEMHVKQSVYLSWVRSELSTEENCLELPFTLILLVSFCCLAIMHLNQQQVFAVEQAIEMDIIENANFAFAHHFGHKGLSDVHSFADFWSWTRLGFLPLMVQPSWSYSEEYTRDASNRFKAKGHKTMPDPPTKWKIGAFGGTEIPIVGDYLHYNRIIGGIRFRQELAQEGEDLCYFPSSASDEVWKKWYGKPCFPSSAGELAFVPDSSVTEGFHDPQRVEWMFTDLDSLDRMLAQAVDMEDGCEQMKAKGNRSCFCEWCAKQSPPQPWITERTQRVEISVATYNPEYGLISMTAVNFFFNRGSFMFKRVELMSSWIDLWSTPPADLAMMLFFDAVWIISLLKVVIGELREIWHIIRKNGRRCLIALKDEYLGPWNFVDWISIITATQAVVNFITLMAKSQTLNAEFKNIVNYPKADRQGYTNEVMAFFEALEVVCVQERGFRVSLCFYPMVVMLRLFKSFAAQPRLAVVTATIANGAQDLLHFFIIFLSVFSCLCLDAVLLFGQDLEEFATFTRALHSCFRLMLGDWDWKSMEVVGRVNAAIWFWIFLLIIVMVMFNVLLAIIMEAYITVKKTAQNADSLWTTMYEMRRRRNNYKAGKRVRLNDIWDAVSAEQKEQGVSEDDLLTEFYQFKDEECTIKDKDGKFTIPGPGSRLLSASFLMDLVDKLPKEQAERTLRNAQKVQDEKDSEPLELEKAHDRLLDINASASQVRNDLLEVFTTVDHYDTMNTAEDAAAVEQAEEEAAQGAALSGDLSMNIATSGEMPVNQQVLESVSTEVGRLTAEVASVLAQTMKHVDKKQNHLEQRQKEMLGCIREMQTKLQMLQSEASSLTTRLQRYAHKKGRDPPGLAWRRGLAGSVVPGCLSCAPGSSAPPEKT